jgi:hypothetical protein
MERIPAGSRRLPGILHWPCNLDTAYQAYSGYPSGLGNGGQPVRKYNLPEILLEDCAIQAKPVGENIQYNCMRIKGHRLLVFYVWDIKGEYLKR